MLICFDYLCPTRLLNMANPIFRGIYNCILTADLPMENCLNSSDDGNSCWDYYLTTTVKEYLCNAGVAQHSFCMNIKNEVSPEITNTENTRLAKLFSCKNITTPTNHAEAICLPMTSTLGLCSNNITCPTIGNGMFDPLIGICNPDSTCSYF